MRGTRLLSLAQLLYPMSFEISRHSPSSSSKVALIRVVSEYRTKDALPFFANLLRVADGEIWKTALDGIISIGGEAAVNCLHEVSKTLNSEKRPWVDEAVSQITARAG